MFSYHARRVRNAGLVKTHKHKLSKSVKQKNSCTKIQETIINTIKLEKGKITSSGGTHRSIRNLLISGQTIQTPVVPISSGITDNLIRIVNLCFSRLKIFQIARHQIVCIYHSRTFILQAVLKIFKLHIFYLH